MLWITEFELAIACTSGGSPHHIRRLKADVYRWRREVEMAEFKRFVK
jgi:hypothetical protein